MNLTIDIGNSSVKAGVFNHEKLLEIFRFDDLNKNHLEIIKNKYPIKKTIISSVQKNNPDISKLIQSLFKIVMTLDADTSLPVKNQYKTPETLGKDRLAAVVGGKELFPDSHVLIFDVGTAITIDFITKDKIYQGGNISPGLKMRYQALHDYTENLPHLEPNDKSGLIGESTNEAIISGVQNGIIFELNQYIKEFEKKYKKIKTIITGGDANFFDNKLNYRIFVDQNLVLTGLNEILKFNYT